MTFNRQSQRDMATPTMMLWEECSIKNEEPYPWYPSYEPSHQFTSDELDVIRTASFETPETEFDFSTFNPFCHQDPSTPLSYFQGDKSLEDDLFLATLENPQRIELETDVTMKYEVAYFISQMRNTWNPFRRMDNSAHLNKAIELAATLFFKLFPKHTLCLIPRYTAPQLNLLWENLTTKLPPLRASSYNAVEEACKLLMMLTRDRVTYSLVTETDVSEMLDRYCILLESSTSLPSRPYKHLGSGFEENQDQWFKDIMEVVDKMKFPPILMGDDYTHLLITILSGKADEEWLLYKLKINLFPYSGEECSALLKMVFDSLVYKVIQTVKARMMSPLAAVGRPLHQLYHMDYHSHISPEIHDLIMIAEVRRITLGNRYISRSHLLWAFYECGHVLPPQIRKTIKFTSDFEKHPPYHIYLASKKLAEQFSEKVQLQNFMFAVIYLKDIGVDGDLMTEMDMCYEDFLKALDNSSSDSHDRNVRQKT